MLRLAIVVKLRANDILNGRRSPNSRLPAFRFSLFKDYRVTHL